MQLTAWVYHVNPRDGRDVLCVPVAINYPTVTKAYEDFEPQTEPGWNYLNFVIYQDGVLAEYD